MFEKLQQLKELKRLRDQAMAMQKALAQETIVVEEDGIKVVMSGDQKLQKLEVNGEEQSKVADVINKALKESQKVAAKKIQEMGGGLGGLLGR
ncbi:MAG: YbaB/EbfC family nucleoid-associated protein [Candidatus Blackburnbacteria bacterium]|nr:YbaB/EbfC family nucleoid-associated protein [Candidatus Blackburnbacteria bacterium]